jgi:hypothetical protein
MLARQPAHIRNFLLVCGGGAALLLLALVLAFRRTPEWVPPIARTDDTLVPESADSEQHHYTPETLALLLAPAVAPIDQPVPYSLRWRAGVGVPDRDPLYFSWPVARPGWYVNWTTNLETTPGLFGAQAEVVQPAPELGMEFVPMVRVDNGRLFTDSETLGQLAARRPGLTWLIGNEPDVKWQDNTPPEIYAIAYHRAYEAVKKGDPTAQVAIAGLSQITPLRLAYLDRVWDFYRSLYEEEMPVDVWTMHAFVLREERGSWGVNIPPGFTIEQRGQLWGVEDHGDLALVADQVHAMRRWLAEHGQREKPLWITEYGILFPTDYGYPPARVIDFLRGSFDLFLSLRDPELGYGADDNRLVQRWNWYSARDSRYRAGNLYTDWGSMTPVGRAFSRYVAEGR